MKSLIIGNSGVGKTTLARMLGGRDLDEFGYMVDGKWVISLKCLDYRLIDNDLFFGVCYNLTEVIKRFDQIIYLHADVTTLYARIFKRHISTKYSVKQRKARSIERISKDRIDILEALKIYESIMVKINANGSIEDVASQIKNIIWCKYCGRTLNRAVDDNHIVWFCPRCSL